MAKLKTAKNMIQNRDEYARFFTGFRGVDFSSDHTEVADSRFAYLVNMYKDYKSGEGGAVETIPGFREMHEGKGQIYGVHVLDKMIFLHVGSELRYVGEAGGELSAESYISYTPYEDSKMVWADELPFNYMFIDYVETRKPTLGEEWTRDYVTISEDETGRTFVQIHDGTFWYGYPARFYFRILATDMNTAPSTSFVFNDRLYVMDGRNIREITRSGVVNKIEDKAHIPTTHHLILPGTNDPDIAPGVEMEQRNILTPKYKNKFIAGLARGVTEDKIPGWQGNVFQLKYGSDYAERTLNSTGIKYPSHTEVYQYGVKLPWVIESYSESDVIPEYIVPNGFPNAVVSISKEGEVTLARTPPRPQYNTWNPETKAFDYTEEQIENGEVASSYEWPFAFAESYDGIEIIAENAVTNINGIEAKDGCASIITHCTIATVFDNRIFLSGNPEFPTHIFWSALNGETSYPDPTYFGITNNDIEGVTNSPVTAMIPVADQLMVLKKENASEGSVLFHTPTEGRDNVAPRIYPSTQGLPGRGCLGAACNFLDDPVFISRLGLEAMGQLSARYERAIEHRSSLIDARLLTLDLSKAQLVEYEGYLLILVDGKIFMADSRQTFTHESGVMQYEWYYLENIGVWEGQFDECVYARLPKVLDENEEVTLPDELGGMPFLEADKVIDELGAERDLIGTVAFERAEDITYTEIPNDRIYEKLYFKEMPLRDEYGRETGHSVCYYVEPTGAKYGGTFVPAERLYVIGSDLYFSAGRHLCKFNFDKRDKKTGIIPVEYYNFDGRKIFSGCATKMDNCGIPHLVKNTVKRSTVIKTRVFTHSFAKIKVRTNRKAFEQVGRIINGTEVFDGTSFADYTFNVDGKTLFSINEKEKKWVEKQHFIYSDGYCEPFAIHYLAYRYNVAGRYKEK